MQFALNFLIALAAVVIAGAQAWIAVKANQASKKAVEDAAEADAIRIRRDDRHLLLEIHADLTAVEVQAAKAGLNEKGEGPGQSRDLLSALVARSWLKAKFLGEETQGPAAEATAEAKNLVSEELGKLERYVSEEARNEIRETQIRVTQGRDLSKYSWQGKGIYSKNEILQKSAIKWAADNGLFTERAFTASFSTLVREAVGSEPKPERILIPLQDGTAEGWALRLAQKADPLIFQDREYVVSNSAGLSNTGYRDKVQIPLIEHLISKGFPLKKIQ